MMASPIEALQRLRERTAFLTCRSFADQYITARAFSAMLVALMVIAGLFSSTLLYAGRARMSGHQPMGDLEGLETLPLYPR